MVIASKVYFNPGRLSRQAIHREIDGSLKRLGTDYLDLYIIHRFDYDTPMEETMEALNDLVKAGKVRALGASAMYGYQFYNMQLIARDHGWARFQAMEDHYNLLYREDERELIPICKQMGVSLMPYSPLAAGHLTRRTWTADTLRSRTDRVAMGKYDRTEEQDMPIVARVARDEDARSRYLRTIQAKERDMEGMVDRALLARVTANLLDNSRKYGGRENVRVAISARAAGRIIHSRGWRRLRHQRRARPMSRANRVRVPTLRIRLAIGAPLRKGENSWSMGIT